MPQTLSRRETPEEGVAHSFTVMMIPSWVKEVQNSYQNDEQAGKILTELPINPMAKPSYSFEQGLIRYTKRIFVRRGGCLREQLLQACHSSPLGVRGTYHQVK